MTNRGMSVDLRVITPVMTGLLTMMVGLLIWIYLNDRGDNKEFQKNMFNKLDAISLEFKNIRSEHAEYREKTTSQLVAVSAVCCSEKHKTQTKFDITDSIQY